jgi:hypothetical protein
LEALLVELLEHAVDALRLITGQPWPTHAASSRLARFTDDGIAS